MDFVICICLVFVIYLYCSFRVRVLRREATEAMLMAMRWRDNALLWQSICDMRGKLLDKVLGETHETDSEDLFEPMCGYGAIEKLPSLEERADAARLKIAIGLTSSELEKVREQIAPDVYRKLSAALKSSEHSA